MFEEIKTFLWTCDTCKKQVMRTGPWSEYLNRPDGWVGVFPLNPHAVLEKTKDKCNDCVGGPTSKEVGEHNYNEYAKGFSKMEALNDKLNEKDK